MGTRVILSALLGVPFVASSLLAQTAPGRYRVEGWGDLGVMAATPVIQYCCDLRTPPSVKAVESQITVASERSPLENE